MFGPKHSLTFWSELSTSQKFCFCTERSLVSTRLNRLDLGVNKIPTRIIKSGVALTPSLTGSNLVSTLNFYMEHHWIYSHWTGTRPQDFYLSQCPSDHWTVANCFLLLAQWILKCFLQSDTISNSPFCWTGYNAITLYVWTIEFCSTKRIQNQFG